LIQYLEKLKLSACYTHCAISVVIVERDSKYDFT